jgi:putative copper export protein
MVTYILFAYIHIISAICWIGFILFWFLVLPPLAKANGQEIGHETIPQLEDTPWPPQGLPGPVRIKFLRLGLLFITVLALSGGVLLILRGFSIQEITSGHIFQSSLGLIGLVKIILVALVAFLALRSRTRTVIQISTAFLLSLIIVAISVLLVR